MHRPGPHTLLAALVLLAASGPPARAQIDTLDLSSGSLGAPAVASVPLGDLMPLYGAVHAAWTHGTELRHAWKLPDPWQSEAIVDSASAPALAVRGDGSPVVSFSDFHGRLICGERGPSGWAFDTVATYAGSSLMTSIALDPEPVIAYVETPASGPATLRCARRSGGIWTIADLDQGSFLRPPSVAIGPGGKRGIAAGILNGTWANLLWYEAASPAGPFTSAVLDTEQFLPVSLVWDFERDRPMILYGVVTGESQEPRYRFTWRDESGNWQHQDGSSVPEWRYLVASLALDPAGAPGAFWQDWQYILETSASSTPGVNSCGSVGTGSLRLSSQRAAAPSSPFDATFWAPPQFHLDWTSTNRAVASHTFGLFDVVWREPFVSCAPNGVFYREIATGVTAVPFAATPGTHGLTIAPNPLPPDRALRVRWSLPRAGEVRLDAHDLAGRRVASLVVGRLEAGGGERAWLMRGLAPGVYWLALTLDGERIARSALVRR